MRPILVLSAFLAVVATPASAGPMFNVTNIVGSWTDWVRLPDEQFPDHEPVHLLQNVPNQGTDLIRWGISIPVLVNDPTLGSGYDFTPGAGLCVGLNTPFLLGNFVHQNNEVRFAVTEVSYALGLTVQGVATNCLDAVASPVGFAHTFEFSHNETPNTDPGCCDDIVTIQQLAFNSLIFVGDARYYFNILGFSQNEGRTFDSRYISPEDTRNSTFLYGRITEEPIPVPVPVPEPATLMLVGSGLAAAAAARRRARTRRS